MLVLLVRAAAPRMSLAGAFENWGSISHKLAEPKRRRCRQLAEFVGV